MMEDYVRANIAFQEEYKKLDKLCKECYSSTEGVSEYIRCMENESHCLSKYISSWEYDYKMLKHVRWIRNQLAHEVGSLQSDICKQEDLDFVMNFYKRIINGVDPLTQMRKLKENVRKIQYQQRSASANMSAKQNEPEIVENKKTVFCKFMERIKKLFS